MISPRYGAGYQRPNLVKVVGVEQKCFDPKEIDAIFILAKARLRDAKRAEDLWPEEAE